jgi:hypothetical protein
LLGLSVLAFGAVGFAAPSFGLVTLFEGLGGVLLDTGSSDLIAPAAVFYLTVIRSSDVGRATPTGAGRGDVRAAAGVEPDAANHLKLAVDKRI